MPDNWELTSEVEVAQKEVSTTGRPGGDQVDAELLDSGHSGDLLVGQQSLAIDASSDTQTQTADYALTEVVISINCAQGICELLAEHTEGRSAALNHTVILDTADARIWRAAITTLAQSIAVD